MRWDFVGVAALVLGVLGCDFETNIPARSHDAARDDTRQVAEPAVGVGGASGAGGQVSGVAGFGSADHGGSTDGASDAPRRDAGSSSSISRPRHDTRDAGVDADASALPDAGKADAGPTCHAAEIAGCVCEEWGQAHCCSAGWTGFCKEIAIIKCGAHPACAER